jgi:hypothetical protein
LLSDDMLVQVVQPKHVGMVHTGYRYLGSNKDPGDISHGHIWSLVLVYDHLHQGDFSI